MTEDYFACIVNDEDVNKLPAASKGLAREMSNTLNKPHQFNNLLTSIWGKTFEKRLPPL